MAKKQTTSQAPRKLTIGLLQPQLVGRNNTVRALSWKNPFGTAMLHDKEETRVWATEYRGWVLICLSKQSYTTIQQRNICGDKQYERLQKAIEGDPTKQMTGVAIAIGYLTDCKPMSEDTKEADRAFVEYQPGLFRHIYSEVHRIEPFEWKGTQGWKTISADDLKKIKIIE